MERFAVHRNVTFGRLALDLWQEFRCLKPLVRRLGRPFRRSRRYVEIDLTYRCNLGCRNCNRSCTQAPSDLEISLEAIDAFLARSLALRIAWERIRLLGGEPTLHPRFEQILERLLHHRAAHNPGLRIVVCTNGWGARVNRALDRLPPGVAIKNTAKGPRQRLFRPFNRAPVDSLRRRVSDLSAGCRILHDCGIGLTPLGYYPCAIAGGIDRVFGFNCPRPSLPAPDDEMIDQLARFCPCCGHFGCAWPTRRAILSPAWKRAYARLEAGPSDRPSG
jgi:hypothetical protein